MASSGYTKISSFWTFFLPAFVIGLIVYVSNQPGWVGYRVQKIIGPVLDPISQFVRSVFR